jgi:hypothetical protein
MMKRSATSIVTTLGMPLRDLMRGVASIAESTEIALEPALSSLPLGARDVFGRALQAIEEEGARLLAPQIGHDDIRRAAEFLRGTANRRRDAECCARVLGFAWDYMRGDDEHTYDILSETLAVSRLAALRNAPAISENEHAAQLFLDLRGWRVVGSLPGLPISEAAAQREATDLKLFALMAWLLTHRAEDRDAEIELLKMALALTQALRSDILAALADQSRLAAQFKIVADHL